MTKKITASFTQHNMKQLVAFYNIMAETIGKKPVKKFRDIATGNRRCVAIKAEYDQQQEEARAVKRGFDVTTSEEVTISEKKTKAKKVAKKTTKVKKKNVSIKFITISLIVDDKDDKEIVSTIKEQFPDSKFDFTHVSWYRSTLFRDGVIGPEHAPRRSKAYKDWLKTQG